jgi:cellulose synthase/poly-beta-1,6-N-acetylglucosamine synthase-like glycosyltransferase
MIYILIILVLLILAPYIIYPVIMLLLSYLLPQKFSSGIGELPHVTIIIPTYNEEKVIAERVKNLEALQYPADKLQVIIIDSGSNDRTYEIAQESSGASRLDCLALRQEERKGKANAVNHAIKYAKGEIILVSDANALFERDSIQQIVRPFADKKIGGAGGRFVTLGTNLVGKGEELYWSIEGKIREAESAIYSITNFSGEFNSFRKDLGIVLDEKSLAEDFDLSLQIIERGYRLVYVPEAIVYEPAVEHSHDLIKQKKRRAVGTIQVIFKHIGMFLNPKLFVFDLLLFFHKVLRVFTPIIAITLILMLCLYFNSLDYGHKYEALGICAVVILALIGVIEVVFRKGFLRKLYYFFLVQYSYVLAWIEFLTGRYKVTWEKTDSSRDLKNVMDRMK